MSGIISDMQIYALLLVVAAAVLGMFLAGYAAVRCYRAVEAGEPMVGWIVAFVIGSLMTASTVIIGAVSTYFAD